jgi:hypothetical protein
MLKEVKLAAKTVSVVMLVGALAALADGYEWETKLNGIDIELKGTAEQVRNPKLQKECLKMAAYAMRQFQANGGVLIPGSHEIECEVGPNGRVSALLEHDPDSDKSAKRPQEEQTEKSVEQGLPKASPTISSQR